MNISDEERLTKATIAKKLGISRPTLDAYLINGLPKKIVNRKVDLDVLEIEIIKYKSQIEEKKLRIKHLNKDIDTLEIQIKEIEKEMEKYNDN